MNLSGSAAEQIWEARKEIAKLKRQGASTASDAVKEARLTARQREVIFATEKANMMTEARLGRAAEVACTRCLAVEIGVMEATFARLQRERTRALEAASSASTAGNATLARMQAVHDAWIRQLENALENERSKHIKAARAREERLIEDAAADKAQLRQQLYEVETQADEAHAEAARRIEEMEVGTAAPLPPVILTLSPRPRLVSAP